MGSRQPSWEGYITGYIFCQLLGTVSHHQRDKLQGFWRTQDNPVIWNYSPGILWSVNSLYIATEKVPCWQTLPFWLKKCVTCNICSAISVKSFILFRFHNINYCYSTNLCWLPTFWVYWSCPHVAHLTCKHLYFSCSFLTSKYNFLYTACLVSDFSNNNQESSWVYRGCVMKAHFFFVRAVWSINFN